MSKTNECRICKSSNVVQLTTNNKIYGLVELVAPDKVNLNNFLPVHAFCCKDCGHIELIHIQPEVIQIDKN